jgi:hypothetical protein
MRREEVLHVARAAACVAGVTNVVIVGSQAVLGVYHEDDLPSAALASMEADVLVLHDPDGSAAQAISGAIGHMSMFHRENDYYADGVELSELVFPRGWEGRLLHLVADRRGEVELRAYFPDVHDLCAAKLGAGRPQDRAFVHAIYRHRRDDGARLLDAVRLAEAAYHLPARPPGVRERATGLVAALRRDGDIRLVNPPT